MLCDFERDGDAVTCRRCGFHFVAAVHPVFRNCPGRPSLWARFKLFLHRHGLICAQCAHSR